MSDARTKLDELVDWYESHAPRRGESIDVGVVRGTVLRWGIKPAKRGGPLVYRGRTLIVKPDGYTMLDAETDSL